MGISMITSRDWKKAQSGNINARNKIAIHYQPLVDFCVSKVKVTLPTHVDKDDLKSTGQLGLFDAISKYDLDRGIKFETYAATRIKGAILDDLRSMDWAPRSVRQKEKAVERAYEDLTARLARTPKIQEVADYLELDLDFVQEALASIGVSQIVNIDKPISEDQDWTIADILTSDTSDLSEAFTLLDIDRILDAIEQLDTRGEVTLGLHYYLGYTLAEIGSLFKVTESRVCQIHTKALKQIRQEIVR